MDDLPKYEEVDGTSYQGPQQDHPKGQAGHGA
jgi:hypothetical protein